MDNAQLVDKLIIWLKEKVKTAGCKGVVIGLSGGIDSSLLAAVCKKALPDATLGVIMPCYSNEQDKAHALLVAEKFGISTVEVCLDEIFEKLVKLLPDFKKDEADRRLAQANLKSRLRMVTLYYIANQLKYLVVGSSNRSELAVGYFTKYGDGGVDIMPLGNLVKRQVKELARFLGVPEEIIAKPPSAGLWAGQTSEGELGFSYDFVDGYLLGGRVPPEIKAKIEARLNANAHKRALPPIPDF